MLRGVILSAAQKFNEEKMIRHRRSLVRIKTPPALFDRRALNRITHCWLRSKSIVGKSSAGQILCPANCRDRAAHAGIWTRFQAQSARGASAVQIGVIAIQIANILHSNGTGTSLRGLNRCTPKRPISSPEHWMKRWPSWLQGKLRFCREARIFIPRSAIAWCTDRWSTFQGWENYAAYR